MNEYRLGLGCMGMNLKNKNESIETIREAISKGINLLNTGDFYGQGESELVVGEALNGIDRDKYFISVKFGVLPNPEGGIYGLDVEPFHIKAHLAYSLKRLGLEYIDLYQPARMDTNIPIEDIMIEMESLVKKGLIKHIGLSMVDAKTLRRACKVYPVHTVEIEYSIVNRDAEKELIGTAKELGVRVLSFGAVGHGLLTNKVLEKNNSIVGFGMLSKDNYEQNIALVHELKKIADEKDATVSELAIAWTLSKYNNIDTLFGTTHKENIDSSIKASKLKLTSDDIKKIEEVMSEEKIAGKGMRNFVFTNGRMTLQK